ncbi:hypothetical protein F4805DRAFT_298764 [Annulohypoxylon moriforme]|nr:hypothetical protein F4805DRAFT_298764 [Annulohypoxylon moriforme]
MSSSTSSDIYLSTDPITYYYGIPSVPDISGVGVLIGFITLAYFLLFVVCIHYIFVYDPTLDPCRTKDNQEKKSDRLNPFDQIILGIIRSLFRIGAVELRGSYIYKALHSASDKCVLSLADTQVITGLAILIGGYLSRAGLSAFHWKTVAYLAWFSGATHLSTLVFLRNYLINHPTERRWRLLSMLTLLLCLVLALVPTGHFDWDDITYTADPNDRTGGLYPILFYNLEAPPPTNATLYFNSNFSHKSSSGKNSMILSILLLVLGFATRVFKLHRRILWFGVESISRRAIDKVLKSACFFQRVFGTSTSQDRLVSNIIVSAHITICVCIDLWSSMASDPSPPTFTFGLTLNDLN